MRKAATVFLAGVAALACGASESAAQPDPAMSLVRCFCEPDPTDGGASGLLPDRCTITPSGGGPGLPPAVNRSEDIIVSVLVRDAFGAPLAGIPVTAMPVALAGAIFRFDDGLVPGGPGDPFEGSQTVVTGLSGSADFLFDEGGVDLSAVVGFPVPTLTMSIIAAGVPLVPCPTPLMVTSYDMNGTTNVGLADFGLFAACWPPPVDERCNFDFTGPVGAALPDFGLFVANFGADIDNQ